MKKLLVVTLLLIFALQGIGFAAASSSRPRTYSPPSKPSVTQKAPSPASGYKPSAPASSYSQTAPATKPQTPATSAPQSSNSGFMRGLGLFGGGMLLGSLLGGSFGLGSSGSFATLAGILFNLIILGGIIMLGRFLWDKWRQRRQDNYR